MLWSRIPHPAVLIGNLITILSRFLNNGPLQRVKGVILVIILVFVSGAVGAIIIGLGWVAEILVVAILLAQKSLADHVSDVAQSLRISLPMGRKSVAMIVGRDTNEMTPSQVSRSAIESAAENFSDGVVAPIFWFMIAGVPGVLIYKAINTADSMVGYMTPKYREFGWASARLDDLLNWVPARLTALLFLILYGRFSDFSSVQTDGHTHRSPNAGWPESAMARIIKAAVSGPRSYHGALEHFPWVNPTGRKNLIAPDIEASVDVLWRSWAALLCIAVLFGGLGWLPILG